MRSQQFAVPIASVSTSPSTGVAVVYLRGAVDLLVEPALRDVVERLRAAAPSTVFVDLAGVTFACSTLANFVQVGNALPSQASLVVCRPGAMTRRVLTLTGMGWIPVLDAGPPVI